MKRKLICFTVIIFMLTTFVHADEPTPEKVTVYLNDCDINIPYSEEVYSYDMQKDSEWYQWYLTFIKAQTAWDADAVGRNVKIAVIDSGLFIDHPDIDASKILPGHNYFTGDSNTNYDALHGTRVAGIIMAIRNNGIGINGIADQIQIVPLKAFENDVTSLDRIVKAIYDAVDVYECDIINMSFGTYINTQALEDAIRYAESKGVITVAAVGNSGSGIVYYPAGYDTVIGVGGLNANGTISASSQKNHSVTLWAPGEEILSTAYADGNLPFYTKEGGTSFATPQVTALAGIVKSICPDITPNEFRKLLTDTADDSRMIYWDERYGYGCLNIEKTLLALLDSMLISNIAAGEYIFYAESTETDVFDDYSHDGTVTIQVKNHFIFKNTTRVSHRATLLIGIYDDKQKLVAVQTENIKIKGFGEPAEIWSLIQFSKGLNRQYIQKAFLWDETETMLPLTVPIIKTIMFQEPE